MRLLFMVLALCAVFSCSRPTGYEHFIKATDTQTYCFKFGMTEGCLYDLDFYTRVDRSPILSPRPDESELDITWISPSGERYCETVYLPMCGQKGARIPYRKGLFVPESGDWGLDVKVSGQPSGFCGLGITLQENGTR